MNSQIILCFIKLEVEK